MHARSIGYPDTNQLNPKGDLTLALITEHPDELLSQYKREAHFLMDVTDEQVIGRGGNPTGPWRLVPKFDEKRENPYGRDAHIRTFEFAI
ncbi:MAG: hypothetical protein AAB441_02085 [Patescibacteria group bacterium]